MSFILTINTAFETASVTLSKEEEMISELQNGQQKNHALFLEPAIKELCKRSQIHLDELNAICVVSGPGSYTGLRVGLSSAKALCYALNKPLILLNTLDIMALALKSQSPVVDKNVVYCPLVDARRMEVFTALYDAKLKLIKNYSSEIIEPGFLEKEINNNFIIFGGTGGFKLQKIISGGNILYINPLLLSKPSIIMANALVKQKNFADIAYCEPFYLKPVYFRK